MVSWGLVATVKAPEEQVLAFVAHHLSLGAQHIWLYFDDPDDPAFARASGLHGVTATRCTDAYWTARRGRHERHQNRQARNARDAQGQCKLDWLGHIDVDEFLHAPRPVGDILADQPPETVALRMEPFEAVHTPGLPDDIFTARYFRGPLGARFGDLRAQIMEPYDLLLPKGHLSHTVGKSFCRPQAKGVKLRLHLVFRDKEQLQVPVHPELRLLHFHAQDPVIWQSALPFRLKRGAYQFHPLLAAHLAAASPAEVDHFYQTTQILSDEKLSMLRGRGRLLTVDLGLREKVKALLARGFDEGPRT
jgi:hypothetical protein